MQDAPCAAGSGGPLGARVKRAQARKVISDSLCNGASVRFWESFYGIGWGNGLNTPAWLVIVDWGHAGAMHYALYLATADTHLLHSLSL